MSILKCKDGHYYDDQKYSSCPYCEKLRREAQLVDDVYFNHNVMEAAEDDYVPTEAYGCNVDSGDKTISVYSEFSIDMPVSGWLVCVKGETKGKSYIVRTGRNFAGRSQDMDIVLIDDNYICRENHFAIVYEPNEISFYLVSGEGLTYLNDQPMVSQAVLNSGDKISVGKSEYIFVPFCVEGRTW